MKGAILAVIVFAGSSAHAEGGPFGLGLVVGTPTGPTIEYKLSSHTAIDAALGIDLFVDRHVYVQGDFLFLLPDLIGDGSVALVPYLGPGVFVADFKGGAGFGVRGPFGLNLDFTRAPVEIFVEISLGLQLVHDVHLGVGGALGFRYYF